MFKNTARIETEDTSANLSAEYFALPNTAFQTYLPAIDFKRLQSLLLYPFLLL